MGRSGHFRDKSPEWDGVYHFVEFPDHGPHLEPYPSVCGVVARWWPRIGIRMTDQHCVFCQQYQEASGDDGE